MNKREKWIAGLETPLEVVADAWGILWFFSTKRPPHDWITIGLFAGVGLLAAIGYIAADSSKIIQLLLLSIGVIHLTAAALASVARVLRAG